MAPSGSLTYNLRFPGQYYQAETGLNYNYVRDYDQGAGRYIESDPIGLNGGINTYAYARGKQVNDNWAPVQEVVNQINAALAAKQWDKLPGLGAG